MLTPVQQAILTDINAEYYGVSMERLMENAGKGVADELVRRFGKGRRIAFVCGPGNNGGDGLVAARHLAGRAEPAVYLVGGAADIKSGLTRKNWQRLKTEKRENIQPNDLSNDWDVVVECLFGTGISGSLKEPYQSIVQKINRFKGQKVSVDMPAPGFRPGVSICLETEKVAGSPVVDIGVPKRVRSLIGPGEVKMLSTPKDNSHKGDNGRVLVIAGSDQYHGAVLLASKMAAKLVDLVYVSSTIENNKLVSKLKSRLAEFIAVERGQVLNTARTMDVILAGPGLGREDQAGRLLKELFRKYPQKKYILDADALRLVKPSEIPANSVITPHKQEFKQLFGLAAGKTNLKKVSKKYGFAVVLKGKTDYVAWQEDFKKNTAGSAGMTKGGTGDVLAGLVAGLAVKNDLDLAARAAVFLNGRAGEELEKRKGHMYSASELINEVPKVYRYTTR